MYCVCTTANNCQCTNNHRLRCVKTAKNHTPMKVRSNSFPIGLPNENLILNIEIRQTPHSNKSVSADARTQINLDPPRRAPPKNASHSKGNNFLLSPTRKAKVGRYIMHTKSTFVNLAVSGHYAVFMGAISTKVNR